MVSVGLVSSTMVLTPMLAALHCRAFVMCMFADLSVLVGSLQLAQINQVLLLVV
jgi:hypothetical protein